MLQRLDDHISACPHRADHCKEAAALETDERVRTKCSRWSGSGGTSPKATSSSRVSSAFCSIGRKMRCHRQGRTRRETDCTTGPRTESGNHGNAARTEVLRQTQWRGLRVELRAGAELVRTPATEPGFRC